METKTNPLPQCQLKFGSSDDWTIEGYLSVYNAVDALKDTVFPGAFDKSLDASEVFPAFINHDHKSVPVGSLVAKSDDHGLFVTVSINPDHVMGKTVYTAAKRGDITGLSMGYMATGFDKKSEGGRNLTEIDLKEGSLVTFPCETQARIVAVKSEDLHALADHAPQDFEHFLREAGGFSKKAATDFVSLLSKSLQRESAEIEQRFINDMAAETRSLLTTLRKSIR